MHAAFTGAGPFGGGHLDFLRSDGTVECTSLVVDDAATSAAPSRRYVGADWLDASKGPVLAGPVVDARTGELVVISVVPVPDGSGFVAVFLDLDTLGPGLADRFAGRLALEFVVTTADDGQILTRSLDAERWVGASTDATPFDVADGDATIPMSTGWNESTATPRCTISDGGCSQGRVATMRWTEQRARSTEHC